jgi:3-deoxy-manno-octulosonate cytidylyltransferase (CMP-KDO synthetase)
MKKIAVIPARYASTRFPGKLMQLLGDKTIIRTTYENTLATALFDDVLVATDSEIIYNEIIQRNGHAVMSIRAHESGSDRIAEAIENMNCDVVLNVQGDEPFVHEETLQQLLHAFDDEAVQVASLMHQLYEQPDIENPNNVKVVVDKNFNALLFSRSVIPFTRDKGTAATYYKHIGVYAYRKNALVQFTQWLPGVLEQAEKLEQLRYLENGMHIKMILTKHTSIGIDTPGDLELAKQFLSQQENSKNKH